MFNYKTNIRKSKGFNGAAQIAALVFSVALAVMFASLIFGNLFVSAGGGEYITTAENEYYCIKYKTCRTLAEAQKAASHLRLRGGGGFIHDDGKYSVYAALYLNSADAQSVCKRLKEADGGFEVEKITVPSCRFYCGKEEQNITAAAFQLFNFTIESLYSIFIEADKNIISENDIRHRLAAIKNQVLIQRQQYQQVAEGKHSARLKAELASLEINLNIINEVSLLSENISVEIKYYTLKIAFSYQKFIEEIK